jgi:lipoate-protein ligase A
VKLYTSSGSPFIDLAFERQLLEEYEGSTPAAFIYEWKTPCLVIGYAQQPDGINFDQLRRKKIELFRRVTGGTGVLHTDSLSLSLYMPNSNQNSLSIKNFYGLFLGCVQNALVNCGVKAEKSSKREKISSPVCFLAQGGETLLFENRKFFGGAQARKKNVLMVQGTMLFDMDYTLYEAVFGIPKSELQKKITAVNIERDKIKAELVASLAHYFGGPERCIKAAPSEKYLKEYSGLKWSPLSTA